MRHPAQRSAALGPPAPRGAASLVVVMLLFFLMALVAIYTSRNMIFEQRTSANQYRSSQAFEAAEAGLNWALAQLNGGRVDAACLPTSDTAQTSFRARYIDNIDADGSITVKTRTGGAALLPACVFDPQTGTWRCDCPADAATSLPAIAAAGAKPMFRLRFEPLAGPRRDVIRIVSAGCTRADPACLSDNPNAPPGDAIAVLSTLVTLRSGLATLPGAALTVRGDVDAGAGPLQLSNLDPASQGLTVLAGGSVSGNVEASSLPGTPGQESIADGDARLGSFSTATDPGARMFGATLGMTPDLYRNQPGAVILPCAAGCNAAAVNTAAAQNPGKVLWIEGNLSVDGDIGAAPTPGTLAASELAAGRPVMMVVTGTATLSSGTVYGAIYSRAANWDRGAGTTQVRGAVVAEGRFSGAGSQQIDYDPDLLKTLRSRNGSFVRVPGGWKDF
jgi:PilX N-terminal